MGPNKSHNGTKWESQKCTVFQLSLIKFLSGEDMAWGGGGENLLLLLRDRLSARSLGKNGRVPLGDDVTAQGRVQD